MTKDWDNYKDEIEVLYVLRGYTLEKVRKTMNTKYGFNAAPRSYKMKLDEWKFKKYASKRSTGSPHKDPRKPSPGYAVEHQPKLSSSEHSPLHQAEVSDTMIRSPPSESTQLSVNPQLTTSIQGATKIMGRTNDKISSLGEDEVKILEPEFGKDPDPTFQKMFQFSPAVGADLGRINNIFRCRRAQYTKEKWESFVLASEEHLASTSPHINSSRNSEEQLSWTANLGPLVNSSLMFFSTRPHSESLKLLANAPGMAPRALEILLRNWRSGGECMRYASLFLHQSQYCHTILGVNWTRWNHSDETLFDLIDQNLPQNERSYLTKDLLRADLCFQHPLTQVNAPWADSWRLAIRQTEWAQAKELILGLNARNQLRECAFAVLAEQLHEKVESIQFVRFRPTGPDGTFVPAEREYALILQDSQEESEVELDERFAKYLLGFFHD